MNWYYNFTCQGKDSVGTVDWKIKLLVTEMLYICLQYSVCRQSLHVTVESVPYDVTVIALMTVMRNAVSVTLYYNIAMHMDMHNNKSI